MAHREIDRHVAAVRGFNRFYTKQIGVLREGMLQSPYSLAEARVLYELAHRESATAVELGKALELDAGYLSRILRRFHDRRLITRRTSARDGRQHVLALTSAGRRTFDGLDARSSEEAVAWLAAASAADRRRLLEAMDTIQRVLGPRPAAAPSYVLRGHQPGDMGWVVHRHGVLYAQEYGYDERFEAFVAGIVAAFIERFDARRERCWMAELDGEIVGSVFLVRHTATIAKLRLLLVEPAARGFGIGRRLVAECVRFARQAGYRKVTLYTHEPLHAARHLYEEAGFRLVRQEQDERFDQVAETWDLKL